MFTLYIVSKTRHILKYVTYFSILLCLQVDLKGIRDLKGGSYVLDVVFLF